MQSTQGPVQVQRGAQLEFYDTWVARDIDGSLLTKRPPYVTDPYSLERIAKGLPFPAKCCWNGVVAMTAAPFTQHSLRVRCAAQSVHACAGWQSRDICSVSWQGCPSCCMLAWQAAACIPRSMPGH